MPQGLNLAQANEPGTTDEKAAAITNRPRDRSISGSVGVTDKLATGKPGASRKRLRTTGRITRAG
jgi:hypothetical protein